MNSHWKHIGNVTKTESERFHKALENPLLAQETCLWEILQSNANCETGLKYRFADIKTVRDYQSRIAVSDYTHIENQITRIANGEQNILYCGTTTALEQTSGSVSGSKLIPFTNTSLRYIRRGIFPWLYDLITNQADITSGKMYWSVSPQTRAQQKTKSGIPVGFNSDAEYFGKKLASDIAAQSVWVEPTLHNNDIHKWRFLTARQLLTTSDLAFISIWSPTFILELFRFIQKHGKQLIDCIRTGAANGFQENIDSRFPADPDRANVLCNAITDKHINIEMVWPKLDMLSCWTHGSSSRFIPQLEQYFSVAQLQAKGLLATEGIMSIPLCDSPDPVLSVNSGFYEFMDRNENAYLCHEVNVGEKYRLLVTMPNGLYRYDTGDYIEITGTYRDTPTFRFVGRAKLSSDICGEKLNDAFVSERLRNIIGFSLLAPSINPKPRYVLYLDSLQYDVTGARSITSIIEKLLQQNPQYAYARQLGQLEELSFNLVDHPTEKYIQYELAQGKKLGDIKPPCLRPETDWGTKFCRH